MYSATRSPILKGVTMVGASAIAISSFAAPPAAIHAPDVHLTSTLENPVDVLAPVLQQTLADMQGLVTTELTNPAPILQAVLTNQTNNAFSLATGALGVGAALGDGVFNAPAAIATAGQQVLSGDFADALTTLQNATLVPVTAAAAGVVQTLQGIITNQLTIASRLAVAIPNAALTIVGATVNSISQIALATMGAGLGVVAAVTTLDPVNVLNAITDGVANVASVTEQTTIGLPGFVAPSPQPFGATAAAGLAPTVVAARTPSILGAILIGRRQIANAILPRAVGVPAPIPAATAIAAAPIAATAASVAASTAPVTATTAPVTAASSVGVPSAAVAATALVASRAPVRKEVAPDRKEVKALAADAQRARGPKRAAK